MDRKYLTISLNGLTDAKYDEAVRNASDIQDTDDGGEWCTLILRMAEEIKRRKGIEESLKYLKAMLPEYGRIFPNLFDKSAEILKGECHYNLEADHYDEAKANMKQYMYKALAQVDYKAKVDKMRFYSFRGFSDHSLKDIKEEKITLAHPRMFNDPLDTILVWWMEKEIERMGDTEIQKKYTLLMKKVAENIKIRCLIAGKDKTTGAEIPAEKLSSLMWAHYANSHKGFCVEYELDRSFLKSNSDDANNKITLINEINYTHDLELAGEPSIKEAIFNKGDFWSYEREVRLVQYDGEGKEDFPTLDCKSRVKAVYLGVKCSDIDRREMEKAIGSKDIALYQMKIDGSRLTNFNKHQIG